MPRSALFRALALVLFVVAGSAEPAWALAHALTHLHGHHEAESPSADVEPGNTLEALGHNHGHDHPVLQIAARPSGELAAIGMALPSAALPVSLGSSLVRVTPPPATDARAGPDIQRSSQPRAPPLL